MSIKLGFAVVALAAAMATTAYTADKGGGSHGTGGHGGFGGHEGSGFGGHIGGGHSGNAHASRGGEHGGDHGREAKAGHDGHGHGGKVRAGSAGAFRNPLYWLYWPFAYYGAPDQLTLTCGEDVADIASLPLDQFHDVLHPTDELAAALDDLGLAVTKATQDIKIACPSEPPLTAPGRMAAMQRRIEAMIAAVELVQPPLQKFYGLLNDEQKAKVNALAAAARQAPPAEKLEDSSAENCGSAALSGMELPVAQIDKAVHLSDPERTSLVALQNADTQAAADLLKASCGAENTITPPARLAAAHKRLDVMLAAAKAVSTALNDFYGTMSDEQKAKFEAIGPIADNEIVQPEPAAAPAVVHRVYGPPPVGAVIRHFLPF